MHTQGIFSGSADIGEVKHKGSVVYDSNTGQYIISGSGTNMWYGSDEFHLAWAKAKGDFVLYTSVEFVGDGIDPHRKAGLIIRKDLDPASAYVGAACHGDGLIALQYRPYAGFMTEEIRHGDTHSFTIQLERRADLVTMKAARLGEPLELTGEIEIDLGDDELFIGLFVCAHHADVVEQAVFSNTRLIIPAPDDLTPYRDFLGSRLEIMDVETGIRKIVYEAEGNLEAPNWSPDGQYLIVNSYGRLYRIEIATGIREEIYTGFATSLNNDHGISPDGKRLVISHHVDDLPSGQNSIIFTLPYEGGTPVRVTEKGPSYWHGWSPDGKYLIYTGNRNGQWDIYRIPAEGGEEVQMTNSPGLDDGSSYSSDGQQIWFNSNRTGAMEIWRMNADGSNPKQVTSDSYQNWFPHESPDGSKVIFLSYLPDVDPWDHPYYRHVMLRIMDTETLVPKVIAHLYGGQGTINVPSWSPDGKKVAFVSNTQK